MQMVHLALIALTGVVLSLTLIFFKSPLTPPFFLQENNYFFFFFCHKVALCQLALISRPLRPKAAICGFHVMTMLHRDICYATWWDSKLFNALIQPKM